MPKETKQDSFIAIPASLAGIYMVIVVLFLLFANNRLDLIVPIAWAFVTLGVFALLFSYKAGKR
jgi:type IV secretory pathway VirB3-like protein